MAPWVTAAALAAATAFAAEQSAAQIAYEDFRGNYQVGTLRTDAGPSYYNKGSSIVIGALQAFAGSGASPARSGIMSSINIYQTGPALADGSKPTGSIAPALCDNTRTGHDNSEACQLDIMGRAMWARVQFPQAGNYQLSFSHDDEVLVDVSSDYRSANYKSISYNLALGALSSWTNNDTAFSKLPNKLYAPQANSCAWVRIYWNNNEGVNHLRMRWTRPDGSEEIVPASQFLSMSGTPATSTCAAGVTASGTTLQLVKQLDETGRRNPADQFAIQIAQGTSILNAASSSGAGTGTVARTGTILATVNTTYTLSEAMVAGSVGTLADYTSSLSCTRNGVPFTPTLVTANPPVWTVKPTASDQKFLCTILNKRVPLPPVASPDSRTGLPWSLSTAVSVPVLGNDADPDGVVADAVIRLTTQGAPAGSFLSDEGRSLTVPGQGIWRVDQTQGAVTFTPDAALSGQPNPIRYTITDADEVTSAPATVTISYVPTSDVAVRKVASTLEPEVGSEITFHIAASNAGPFTATGVTVLDLLSSGYDYVSHSGLGTYVPATGVWTPGDIVSGSETSLQITARVKASGEWSNTAEIRTTTTDPDTSDNTSTVTPGPVPVSNLSIVKKSNLPAPNAGDAITFTLEAANAGPSPATNVVVQDKLPAGYTYVSHSGGAYDPASGEWTIGNLAVGASPAPVLTIQATVRGTGPHINTATIAGAEKDPAPLDNTSSVGPGPLPRADLQVRKRASSMAPEAGQQVTFTLQVTNLGLSSATDVTVLDVLPSGYLHVSNTSAGAYDPATGVWTIGALDTEASKELQITALVLGKGDYSNGATISGGQPDPNFDNNTSIVTPVPVAVSDLAIDKIVDAPNARVGEIVTFKLVVSNQGPSAATDVSVVDHLPSGYSLVGSQGVGSYDPATGRWAIGGLAALETAQLEIRARVLGSGERTNTATVSGREKDPDGSNNTSSVTVAPVPVADVALVKSVDNSTPKVGEVVVFTLRAQNNGPSDATDVSVHDILPSSYEFLSSSGSYDPLSGTWRIGTIANGDTTSLVITARVGAVGPWTNIAQIGAAEDDPTPDNNTSSVTPIPVPQADLALTKVASTMSPLKGGRDQLHDPG